MVEKVEEEQLETPEAPQEEKPKDEAPVARPPTLEKLREIESNLQKKEAAANKRAGQAERQVESLTSRIQDLEREVEESKLYGDDEDAKVAHRKLNEARTSLRQGQDSLEEREGNVRASEKALAIWTLNQTYGIPVEELEELETAAEMEIAALKWERTEKAKAEEKPAAKAKVPPPESGEQKLPRKSVANMNTEEFNAYITREKARTLKETMNR